MTIAGWVSSIKTTPTIIKKSWSIAKMKETGSNEHEANGPTDKSAPTPYPNIHVVDGVTGLTPDMLRVRDKFARARDFTRQFQEPKPDYDTIVQDASQALIVSYTNYVWSPREQEPT